MTGPIVRTVEESLFDVILSRPSTIFGAASKLPKNVLQRAKVFEALATSTKREVTEAARVEQFLLPHGNVVTGGMIAPDIQARLGIKPVIVNGVDETPAAIRSHTGTIRMDWSNPGILKLEVPSKITDEQVTHLSRYFDNNQLDAVQIVNPSGAVLQLKNPLGAQVEDALYEVTGKYATRKSRITPELIKQYQEQGVFRGQAGLLDDGSPVEVRSKAGDQVTFFDPTANKEMTVHQDKLTVLPTTLEDQFKPNNIFTSYLSDEEKVGIAKLRQGLGTGLGRPIKKFTDLETLAGSRGLIAEKLNRGKVAIVDMASGERQQFDGIQSAVASIRQLDRPAPDLTPDLMKKLLGGNANVGFVGLNGSPPKFGEQIPVPTNIVFDQNKAKAGLPGGLEYIIKPMRGLFQDMQRRSGLPFGDLFLNIQEATVKRQNFNARWMHGKGRPLEEAVMPLDRIRQIAGKDADPHLITSWLESGGDPTARALVEKQMSAAELKAAGELRKYYNLLFKDGQVVADYIENYAPHWRTNANKFGNDIYEIWRATKGKDPLPKAATFFADYYRTGMIDVYDTDAFRVAARYTHALSSNRFMSVPLEQVENFLHQVPDRALVKPMAEYMQALRGFEFIEQKQMIERTLQSFFGKMPGLGGSTAQGLADKLSDLAIGLGYSSSLAFRFPAVLRNFTQVFQTTYGIFGHGDGAFVEGLGRAMTRAGKLQAVEDGAISFKSASVFGRQEIDDAHPFLKRFSDAGFKMYDNADEFTRAASYWISRENAMRSIAKYAKRADSANPARSKRALDQLLVDSKAYMFEDNIQKEFLRRMVADPESAARFLGKQHSDVTQFLYGRGMQPYWMRSVWGKFLGQYGTWSLWYIDYLSRTTKNLMRAGHTGEAIKFIGRNAVFNAAILYAGKEVLDVDMSRWLAYPAIFYSGGPGAQVAVGMMDLFRGLSDKTSGSESEFAQSRVTEGLNTLANAGLSYVPFRSAARDAYRLSHAIEDGTYTAILAAMLGTKPTKGYTIGQQLDALFPGGPLGYEEWMRHRADAPQGPSASALSEVEFYKAKVNSEAGPLGVQLQSSGGSPEQSRTGPPSREAMGLPPSALQSSRSSSSQSTTRSGPSVIPGTAESEPLNR